MNKNDVNNNNVKNKFPVKEHTSENKAGIAERPPDQKDTRDAPKSVKKHYHRSENNKMFDTSGQNNKNLQ